MKGATSGLLNTVVSILSVALLLPLIIRFAGMEAFGVWSVLAIFSGSAALLDFGFAKSLVHFSAQSQQAQSHQEANLEVRTALFYAVMVIAVGLVLVTVLCLLVGMNPIASAKIPEKFHTPLFVSGMIILTSSLLILHFQSIFEASYRVATINVCWMIETILTYGGILISYIVTEDVVVMIYSTAAVHIIMLVVHVVLVKELFALRSNVRSFQVLKSIFHYSSRVYVTGLASMSLLPLNRYVFIELDGSMEAYGVFNMALKIAHSALSLLVAFSSPLFAHFSAIGREKLSEACSILNRYTVMLVALYVVGIGMFFVMGDWLIGVVFGQEIPNLYHSALILLCGVAFYGIGEPYNRTLWAIGVPTPALSVKFAQVVVNIILIATLFQLSTLERLSYAYSVSCAIASIGFVTAFRLLPNREG